MHYQMTLALALNAVMSYQWAKVLSNYEIYMEALFLLLRHLGLQRALTVSAFSKILFTDIAG